MKRTSDPLHSTKLIDARPILLLHKSLLTAKPSNWKEEQHCPLRPLVHSISHSYYMLYSFHPYYNFSCLPYLLFILIWIKNPLKTSIIHIEKHYTIPTSFLEELRQIRQWGYKWRPWLCIIIWDNSPRIFTTKSAIDLTKCQRFIIIRMSRSIFVLTLISFNFHLRPWKSTCNKQTNMGAINGMECTLGQHSITFREQAATKQSYLPYTLQLFFTTAMIFFNSFIYGQQFSQDFF